jgi:hypothetical protein
MKILRCEKNITNTRRQPTSLIINLFVFKLACKKRYRTEFELSHIPLSLIDDGICSTHSIDHLFKVWGKLHKIVLQTCSAWDMYDVDTKMLPTDAPWLECGPASAHCQTSSLPYCSKMFHHVA